MRRIFAIILILSVLCFSACGRTSEDDLDDLLYEEYINGMVEGEYQAYDEIFSVLYSSVPSKINLKLNQSNVQNQFKILITRKNVDYITCSMYFNKYTQESLLENKNIYFAIYGVEEFEGEYYFSVICRNARQLIRDSVTDWSSHTATADFLVYSSYEYLSIVIIIDGNIYAYKCTI